MSTDKKLNEILTQSSGARFYRCALQVNPWAYLKRHSKALSCASEAEYNKLIVDACKTVGIEVIGVADHYRIRESVSLIQAAEAAGLTVFPGFEAETKDGVHFLCLFEPGTAPDLIQAKINDCGVHSDVEPSPSGKYDCEELLEEVGRWGGRVHCSSRHQREGAAPSLEGANTGAGLEECAAAGLLHVLGLSPPGSDALNNY